MAKFNYLDYEINYEVHGQGEPLIILNGIMMSTKSWHEFLPRLKDKYQVILLDFIDQGLSSSATTLYNYELQTEVLKALIDLLQLDNINLVGISYGAQIALDYSTQNNNKVKKLILFNTTSYVTPLMKEFFYLWLDAIESKNGEIFYRASIPTIYSQSFYQENLEWMKNREKILLPVFNDQKFLDRMERLVKSTINLNLNESINEINASTLIIASQEDFLTPMLLQEELNKNIKNSNLIILPRTGHATMYERPVIFISLIVGFIES